MPKRTTVLVLDDDTGMADLLTGYAVDAGFRTVRPVHTIEAFRRSLNTHPTGIALVDIKVHGSNALNKLAIIRERHPTLKVIVVSGYGDRDHVQQAFCLGCEGFIEKSGSIRAEVMEALRTVAAGGTYLSPVFHKFDNRIRCVPRSQLSRSQLKLLTYLRRKKTQKEIAVALRTTRRGIERQVRTLRTKLGLEHRRGHVDWCLVLVEPMPTDSA